MPDSRGGWVRTETLKCIDFLLRWIKIKSFLFPCALFLAHAVLVFMFSATDFFFCSFFSNEITVAQTYIHGGWVLQKRDSWTCNHRCNKGSLFAHLIVCTHSKHIRSENKKYVYVCNIGAANNNDSLSHLPQLPLLLLLVVVVLMLFSVSFLPLSQSRHFHA